jgi:hypothetical protein
VQVILGTIEHPDEVVLFWTIEQRKNVLAEAGEHLVVKVKNRAVSHVLVLAFIMEFQLI